MEFSYKKFNCFAFSLKMEKPNNQGDFQSLVSCFLELSFKDC
jgi:hypothetical protein